MLIDTGYDKTSDTVVAWLAGHGIKRIDAMIISHYDKDHVGGAADIIKVIPVSYVYLPDYEGDREGYLDMMKWIQKRKIPYEHVSNDKSFTLGDAQYMLYPSALHVDDDDNMSLAAAVRYHDMSALFTGDMEDEEMECFMADHTPDSVKCDILKLPHHGRIDMLTGELIDTVSPGLVLANDSDEKKIADEVRLILEDRDIPYYNSSDCGSITVSGIFPEEEEGSSQNQKVPERMEKYTVTTDR